MRRAAVDEVPFDLAILDMQMPEMDGLALAREIRADGSISPTAIIIMSSLGKTTNDSVSMAGEVDACLSKPVRQAQLIECILAVIRRSLQINDRTAIESDFHAVDTRSRTRSRPLRILVAEDNAINQKVALRQLNKLGHAGDAVANGIEAIDALQRVPYDIVFMDCQMPEMDGYQAAREIRRREGSSKHTTIIAMTAHALVGDREKCIAAGMDDYISKPVKTVDLKRIVAKWQNINEISEPESSTSSAEKLDSPVDLSYLREAANDDPGEMHLLAELYLLQTRDDLERLRSAVVYGSAFEIERISHTCAGASASIGAKSIVPSFRELEAIGREGDLTLASKVLTRISDEFERIDHYLAEHALRSSQPVM
jgi:CheY-like chemotaxis protein